MKSVPLILPWGDVRWQRPQFFLPFTIALISICTSVAAILYSGLWLFVVTSDSPAYLGWAAPWLFGFGGVFLALFLARIISARAKSTNFFVLLGPLRLLLAALLWPEVLGRGEQEELFYSFIALLLEGFVFAFITAPNTPTTNELSSASVEAKHLGLPLSFSLVRLCKDLIWRFALIFSLKKDGSYARQDRMLRRAAFGLVLAGSASASVCSGWFVLPGLVAILLGFGFRASLFLRDRARISWLKMVLAGKVSSVRPTQAQPEDELPIFYLGEGLEYDGEISLVIKEEDAYRDQTSRLVRVPSQLDLAERFARLRARGIIAFALPLLLFQYGLSYRTSHVLSHFYDNNPRPVLVDFDRDSDLDLLWWSGWSTKGLAISFNDGSGQFSYPIFVPSDLFGAESQRLTLLDIDADSTQELVLLSGSGYVMNHQFGAITFSPVSLPRGLLGEGAVMSPLRDLDGDQDLDLVECTERRIALLINNGEAPPSIASEVSLRELSSQSQGYITCEDLIWLDNTSTLLIIGSNGLSLAPSAVFSVKAEDAELFGLRELPSVTNTLEKPLAGDVNGDGHLDLLGANPARFGRFGLDPTDPRGFTCYLYTGDGSGLFTFQSQRDACPNGYYFDGLVLGDIDADTDLDLVAVSHLLQVHLNNGAGFFERVRHSAIRFVMP